MGILQEHHKQVPCLRIETKNEEPKETWASAPQWELFSRGRKSRSKENVIEIQPDMKEDVLPGKDRNALTPARTSQRWLKRPNSSSFIRSNWSSYVPWKRPLSGDANGNLPSPQIELKSEKVIDIQPDMKKDVLLTPDKTSQRWIKRPNSSSFIRSNWSSFIPWKRPLSGDANGNLPSPQIELKNENVIGIQPDMKEDVLPGKNMNALTPDETTQNGLKRPNSSSLIPWKRPPNEDVIGIFLLSNEDVNGNPPPSEVVTPSLSSGLNPQQRIRPNESVNGNQLPSEVVTPNLSGGLNPQRRIRPWWNRPLFSQWNPPNSASTPSSTSTKQEHRENRNQTLKVAAIFVAANYTAIAALPKNQEVKDDKVGFYRAVCIAGAISLFISLCLIIASLEVCSSNYRKIKKLLLVCAGVCTGCSFAAYIIMIM